MFLHRSFIIVDSFASFLSLLIFHCVYAINKYSKETKLIGCYSSIVSGEREIAHWFPFVSAVRVIVPSSLYPWFDCVK